MQIFVLRTLSHFKCVNEIEGETFWLVIPLTWLGWLYHSPGLVGYTTDLALLVIPQIWTVDRLVILLTWPGWLTHCSLGWIRLI